MSVPTPFPPPYPTSPAPRLASVPPSTQPTAPVRQISLRVGDAERTSVCDTLATHFAEGRLSADELDARLAAATGAVTRADLSLLLADLPLPVTPRPPRPVQVPPLDTSRFTGMDLLVTMAVICSVGIVMLMMLAIGLAEPPIFVASAFGGTLALVIGAGTAHLAHRSVQRRRPPGR